MFLSPEKRILTIISGGQTGVDRAALDVAMDLQLPVRGWCPLGREAEDGPIHPRYPLQECSSKNPALRTELNALCSQATLVLSRGTPQDGTPLTVERARAFGRPVLELSLDEFPDAEKFWQWINENNITNLNIGGPRESFDGNVYLPAVRLLRTLLNPYK